MSATNLYTFRKNLRGAAGPHIVPMLAQAGSTQALKMGEICVYNETSGYIVPVDAAADMQYSLVIVAEEQKAADVERYIQCWAPREDDVFEYTLASSSNLSLGAPLTLTASQSQQLTYSASGQAVAFYVDRGNYPDTGTTIRTISKALVCFNPEFSYYYKNIIPKNIVKCFAVTSAYTLLMEDCGAIITNKGASGSVTVTAPNAVVPAGWNIKLAVMADQTFVFDPKPDTAKVYIKGAAQTAGKYVSVTDIGDFAHLVWDGTDWLCYASVSGADADITVET